MGSILCTPSYIDCEARMELCKRGISPGNISFLSDVLGPIRLKHVTAIKMMVSISQNHFPKSQILM